MRSMLAHAYHWHVAGFETDIPLSRYIDSWGRPGDMALIAMEGGHRSAPPGSASSGRGPGYGFVDERDAGADDRRRPVASPAGIGQELLDALLERRAQPGYPAVSLSVEHGSPAVGFYERNGFAQVGDVPRRVHDAQAALVAERVRRAAAVHRRRTRVDRVRDRRLAVEHVGAGVA